MPQTAPPSKPISASHQIAPLAEILSRRQWNRFLQLTRGMESSHQGAVQERCFLLLIRALAARDMHDRRTFERSAMAYRQASERLTPAQRTALEQMILHERFVPTYQNPRYHLRPRIEMSASVLKSRGLSPAALGQLHKDARDSVTDALYLWHDGKVIMEDHFDAPQQPCLLMSVTKVITAMAMGRLLDKGKLKSLDQPAADFFPEWNKDDKKKAITLRHLMTHTAGLSNGEDLSEAAQSEMTHDAQENTVAFGRTIRSDTAPGNRWIYSNLAFILLGDIVRQVSGQRLDAFVNDAFFAPMGITEWTWRTDRSGNVEAHGHLSLWAQDMAKFGVLMLDGGVWKGKRLLSDAFVKESLRDQTQKNGVRIADAPTMGLAWFLETRDRVPRVVFGERTLQEWRKMEVPAASIAKILPYKGHVMPQAEFEALTRKLYGVKSVRDGAGWSRALGILHYPPVAERVPPRAEDTFVTAFHHSGSGGQFLLCLPEKRFIAARQTSPKDLSDIGKDSGFLSFNYEAAAVAESAVFPTEELLL